MKIGPRKLRGSFPIKVPTGVIRTLFCGGIILPQQLKNGLLLLMFVMLLEAFWFASPKQPVSR